MRTTPNSLLLTGSAGTGKTSLLRMWRDEARPVVLAPTGIAALQAEGQTIHSFFGFKPELLRAAAIRAMGPPTHQPLNRLRTLVIDEISMVRADLMGAVEARLRAHGPQPGTPFGGVRVILVGDLLQLPPVVDEGLEDYFASNRTGKGYASQWWFEPSSMKNWPTHVVELVHSYRQTDARFVALLQHVRGGVLTAPDEEVLHDRVRRPADDVLRLTATNAQADSWNAEQLASLAGKERCFRAQVSGDASELENAHWPAPDSLKLKRGARIVFVRNDTEMRRWVNGDVGRVVELGGASVKVRLDRNPQPVHEVSPVTWELRRYAYDDSVEDWIPHTVASFTQLPLNLGWARTIHKAQGQTYENAHIDLGRGAFAPGMTYVALSRVRSLDGLTLEQPLRQRDIWADSRALDWLRTRGVAI